MPAFPDSTVRDKRRYAAIRWGIQTLAFLLVFGAALFLPAGRIGWLWGWLYLVIYLGGQIAIGSFLVKHNPQLITERTSIERSAARSWDRPLTGIVSLFGPLSILVISGLDQRFGWSAEFLIAIKLIGLALTLLGTILVAWSMIANRYFYGFVRVQEEKGHTVASGGPYRYVRHPGYLSGILADLGTPLLLGSWWSLVPASVTIAALVLRTALEDRTLQEELTGYKEYSEKVRFRLFPGIW